MSIVKTYLACIRLCNRSATLAEACAAAALEHKDPQRMESIELCMFCADICRLTATFMSRVDRYSRQVCNLCAAICEDTGHECLKHPYEECQKCAEAALECAAECRRIAA